MKQITEAQATLNSKGSENNGLQGQVEDKERSVAEKDQEIARLREQIEERAIRG